MDEFWRDKIKHRLLILKQKLDKKCSLDWSETEILNLLIDVKLEILNLNAFPDLSVQMDYKLEQILKHEMSNQNELGIMISNDEIKSLLKEYQIWPSNEVNIEDTD